MINKFLLTSFIILSFIPSLRANIIIKNKSSQTETLSKVTRSKFDELLRSLGGPMAAAEAFKSYQENVTLIPNATYKYEYPKAEQFIAVIPRNKNATGIAGCAIQGDNVRIIIVNGKYGGELDLVEGKESAQCYYFPMMRANVQYISTKEVNSIA